MNRFFNFVAQFSDYLISEQKAIYGIKILMQVIKKGRENEEQVCGTLHREFAKLCIKAKCYQHSLAIVDHAVTNFKKGTSPMDIVSYVYYKGLIFTGLKKYDQAVECFKIVISFPAACTHKVHLESYKKLILLSLIMQGKIPSLPKYTHHMIKYKLENSFQTYKHLGQFYIMKEEKSFNELINNSYEEFERDKNVGLIKKLQKTFSQVRICELSDTYLTLQFK
jgi:COP9 signalosome complex subunit 3